jgi:tRNA-specific 2-thiouridylase
MNNSATCVAVAMSGGVDSSTAAAILKDQGYQVIGLTMILSDDIDNDTLLAGVRRVAETLKIDLHVCDFRSEFRASVIDYFIDSYETGLTPNPCVVCNQRIKFGSMLKQAKQLGAAYLATGHYVRIERGTGPIRLLKGVDEKKDQSYFLYRLQQDQLDHLFFPLGAYRKTEIRAMAAEFGLPVADKEESQDLCFIGRNDYRDFLQTYSTISSKAGPIVDLAGNELGVHKGLWNYTVGQRRGLGIASSEPFYVMELDVTNNALVVAKNHQRGKDELIANNLTFISGMQPQTAFQAQVKIRYAARLVDAEITPLSVEKARVNLKQSLPDITPGQSVVFYHDDELLGGGFIQSLCY